MRNDLTRRLGVTKKLGQGRGIFKNLKTPQCYFLKKILSWEFFTTINVSFSANVPFVVCSRKEYTQNMIWLNMLEKRHVFSVVRTFSSCNGLVNIIQIKKMGFTLCEAQIRFSLGYKKDIFGYKKDFFLFVTKQIYVKT